MVGKTTFEIAADYPTQAKIVDETDRYVMGKNSAVNLEEDAPHMNGERYCISQKNPICDIEGKVIGMIGFSIDTTQKKLQEIRFQNETDKLLMHTAQAAHDLRSPVASLLMLIKLMGEIPERDVTALKEVAAAVQKVADNLLNQPQQAANTTNNLPNQSPKMGNTIKIVMETTL